MARGLPTYTPAELERYAQDDLAFYVRSNRT